MERGSGGRNRRPGGPEGADSGRSGGDPGSDTQTATGATPDERGRPETARLLGFQGHGWPTTVGGGRASW